MASNNQEQTKKVKPHPQLALGKQLKTNNKSLMILLGFIAALVTAAYSLFLNKESQNQFKEKNNQLSIQLAKLEQKQEQLEAENSANKEAQTVLQSKFYNLNKQLQAELNQKFYQNQTWLLLKARYCLELAEINRNWNNDINSSLALLQQADQLLKALTDAKIFAIRQAIAKDIAQVKRIVPIDIAGILSRLDAAQNSMDTLGIPFPVLENKSTTENPAVETSTSSAWKSHLQESMNLLGKLVVIRRNDQKVKPLLSPLFTAILQENIRLNLKEAQWAVLNKNPAVYQLALKQAISKLQKNFDEKSQNTAVLINQLIELQEINLITPQAPIGLALPLLNELIDSKNLLQQSTNEQGGKLL